MPTATFDSALTSTNRGFGLILGIHEFADGRVLVNDGGSRQILILNQSLSAESTVLDSNSAVGKSYGPRASPILRGPGDSVFFVDGQSSALVLISPGGALVRALSLPKATDARWIAASASGIDAKGQLVYRGGPTMKGRNLDQNPVTRSQLLRRDSLPIVRANFETRTVDTVARIVLPTDQRLDVRELNGQAVTTYLHFPISYLDEWTVTASGSVAVVRGETYRVEIYDTFGQKTVGPKLPLDWKRIDESEKRRIIDSARAAFETRASAAKGASLPTSSIRGVTVTSPSGLTATHLWVTPNEMIDFWPPLRQGAVTADRDGNIWILPSTSRAAATGVLTYDVVNAKGELDYRVQLPRERSIAGFGRNGLIYMIFKNEAGSWSLETRRLRHAKTGQHSGY